MTEDWPDKAPNTIEECIALLDELFDDFGQIDVIPFSEAIIPTHRLFWDLLNRILILEEKQEQIIQRMEQQ